jgi:outer membrane receptor protein involved in Fe transport
VHAGLRLDYNSIFDQVVPTFRGGYVGHFLRNDLTVKLFYGQAVEEPGWQYLSGSLGTPEAGLVSDPEHSQTGELGADYKLTSWLVLHGSAYYVAFHGTIAEGLEGERRMAGADLGATALVHASGIRQLRLWGYYSPYLYLKQSSKEDGSVLLDTGDLARHKLLLGATLDVNRSFGVTALGRCISEREPVISNPLGTVPAYCVVDANVRLKDVFAEGLTVAFRVTNLLDTQYSHPGLYDADSGNTPGRWEDGQWIGSAGYSNSQMPQPGRAFTLQLGLDL